MRSGLHPTEGRPPAPAAAEPRPGRSPPRRRRCHFQFSHVAKIQPLAASTRAHSAAEGASVRARAILLPGGATTLSTAQSMLSLESGSCAGEAWITRMFIAARVLASSASERQRARSALTATTVRNWLETLCTSAGWGQSITSTRSKDCRSDSHIQLDWRPRFGIVSQGVTQRSDRVPSEENGMPACVRDAAAILHLVIRPDSTDSTDRVLTLRPLRIRRRCRSAEPALRDRSLRASDPQDWRESL